MFFYSLSLFFSVANICHFFFGVARHVYVACCYSIRLQFTFHFTECGSTTAIKQIRTNENDKKLKTRGFN